MAPVIRRLKEDGHNFAFLHTNQHYTKEMDVDIIKSLQLDQPDYNFNIGSLPHAAQTGRAMEGLENFFIENQPSFVIVHGDTNTTLAAAVAAKKLNIPVGHVEAGLRSFDRLMPEEINRILVDQISDVHFAPTEVAKRNLFQEGIVGDWVIVCGNTVVDALRDHSEFSDQSNILDRLKLEKGNYVLATAHRPENVDTKESLEELLELLNTASKTTDSEVIFPIHPRTRKGLEKFGLQTGPKIRIINPVDYIDMLALINNAKLVMTDSGGIQEEAYILKKPLVTMRNSTERPETLTANYLIGTDPVAFAAAWDKYQKNEPYWEETLGDGTTSRTIIDTVLKWIKN